jgi:hypothetical protein
VRGKTKTLKAEHPDQPWMWREDWAKSAIRDSSKATTIGLWVFTLIWNAIAFPVTWVARPQLSGENPLALIVWFFPVVGIILLISAIYQTLRSAKFGTSICHLDRVPIAPGRMFRGDIELKTDVPPADGYRMRVLLINAVTNRTGRKRSTTERLIWDTEIVVESTAAMRSPMGTRVPFQFATPPDSHPTDDQDFYNRYLWRLSASAELPGVDYAAQFDLPVFQTGEKADGSEFEAFEQRHRVEAARHQVRPASGVEITKLTGGGEQFRIHAKKTFGGVLRGLLFLAVWNAAIVAMIHFEAPWGFPAVFIAIDLLLLVSSIDYFFGKSTVEVDANGVRVRTQWLGTGGKEKSYAPAEIASIDGTTAGANSKSFGVTMQLRDGDTRLLGSNLPDRESADTIAAKMMADLGR